MFKANSAKGLTLVEVLASVIITGIIITAMFPFFARIQGKQLSSSGGAATLLQGAICSLETRRLHTLARHSDNGNKRTPGLSTTAPKAPATQIGSLYDALRSETGYYVMSENEIMPFSVVGAFRGGSTYNNENDFIYGNYITWTGTKYSKTPILTYHRVFFFTTEVVALISLRKDEVSKLGKSFHPGTSGNLTAAIKGATESGFGRYRMYHYNTANTPIVESHYRGVTAAFNSRKAIVDAAESLKGKRLVRIFTHYVAGIYESPSETTGHSSDITRL